MQHWLLAAENKTSAYELSRGFSPTDEDESWDPSPSTITQLGVAEGDAVLLWRRGRGGGVVALGEVTSTTPVQTGTLEWSLAQLIEKSSDDSAPHMRVCFSFGKLSFAAPVSARALRASGLDHVVKRARMAAEGRQLATVGLTDLQRSQLNQLLQGTRAPDDMPTAWKIPPGAVVKRSDLHDVYGGSPRLTVGASARTPNAFLFLDHADTGELAPRWDGPVLVAPGQSQWGRGLSHENLAALAHRRRGVPLRVFVARGGESLYIGEFAIEPESPVERWADTGERNVPYSYSERPTTVTTRTPLFRLRQLDGITMPANQSDPFRDTSRLSLQPHLAVDQPAATSVRNLLKILSSDPATAASLSALDEAQMLAALVQRARRQTDLDELRAAVEDPESSEGDLQGIVERMTWIFGGEFLPGSVRRTLTLRDQLDLSLLRPDGTLHGVELKKANIERLITQQRSHLIVGSEVSKAVGQAMNYLRELDEKRPQILVDLDIDCRRASMTVVIGHTRFVTADASPAQVNETLRTFNSHLTRVSVTTYDRLIENAQRSINLAASDG